MKPLFLAINTIIAMERKPVSLNSMPVISPLSLSIGCALFFGAAQTATAATVFTLSLTPPGLISAYVNTNIPYTATLTETGSTASSGTTTVSSILPPGMTLVPALSGGGASAFACSGTTTVSCTRTTSIAVGASVAIPLTLKSSTTGTKLVSVKIGTVTSNVVSTAVSLRPDLSVAINQPAPALKAPAMSQVQVRVNNLGGTTPAPINLSFTLPANVSAPLKFSRIGEHWLCKTVGQIVSCSFDQPLAAGLNTRLRIPVIPNLSGVLATPFQASVAPVTGETNIANNSATMAVTTAVTTWVGTGVVDASQSYTNPVLSPMKIRNAAYSLPLPNPLAPSYTHTPNTVIAPGADSYTLDIKKVKAQILPPGFPATDVFVYGDPAHPDTFTYPAHSIVARSTHVSNTSGLGKPTKVQYLNTLTATTHLLPVDHSIMGASGSATEPDIRSVGHLHGASPINENSDGYPEAWHSPTGVNGTPMSANPPVAYNSNPFDYLNRQEATMLWYHDHSLGLTRLNMYSGLAGLYVLRDDNEMAMINSNKLPSGLYEVPLVLQDRMFNVDGSLAYPDITPIAATATTAATSIGSLAAPSMVPEFFGDVMVVNGVAWPYLQVEPRKYRFRVLNASNARFYTLSLVAGTTAVPMTVIGTEGGFRNAPLPNVNTLTIGPAERYDIIVDFSTPALLGKNITLKNSALVPYPNGGGTAIIPKLHDQLMQFRVNLPLTAAMPAVTLPASLRTAVIPALVQTDPLAPTNKVLLGETVDLTRTVGAVDPVTNAIVMDPDNPTQQLMLGRIKPTLGTPTAGFLGWMDPATETPFANTVETWELFNTSLDAHPVHIHDGLFQVVNSQEFTATLGANGAISNIVPFGPVTLALTTENGWKETVIALPSATLPIDGATTITGKVTRIRMKFEGGGQFVWHCHITEHEDNDMMRPMKVLGTPVLP
jgi:spore coat protein A, manganese oxidase